MSEQKQQSSQKDEKHPWPGLPGPLQHRLSMKWSTIESLRILQQRLAARGYPSTVMLLTPMGLVQGKLTDFTDTYEQSVHGDNVANMDVASAAAHLRTDIWNMYAQKDESLEAIDSGALVHLVDVQLQNGAHTVQLHQLALFASDVMGFSLVPSPVRLQ